MMDITLREILNKIRWYWMAWIFPPPTITYKDGSRRHIRPLWISERREISLDIRIKPKEVEE